MSTRPPKPDIRPGDRIRVQVCAWQGDGLDRRWGPTGETFDTVAGEVRWDGWIAGGTGGYVSGWCVELPANPHHGRVSAEFVSVLDRPWSEPDLFEVCS